MIIFDSLIFIIALSSSVQYSNTTSFVHICTLLFRNDNLLSFTLRICLPAGGPGGAAGPQGFVDWFD